jgi:hypothetical protein
MRAIQSRTPARRPSVTDEQVGTPRRRRVRDLWVVAVGLLIAVGKGRLIADLFAHRVELIVFLGLGLVGFVLRFRPMMFALFAAVLVPVAVAPASTALGVGLGLGTFAVIVAGFLGIATVLHARERRSGNEV